MLLAWTRWAGTSHSLKASVSTLLLGSNNDAAADILLGTEPQRAFFSSQPVSLCFEAAWRKPARG